MTIPGKPITFENIEIGLGKLAESSDVPVTPAERIYAAMLTSGHFGRARIVVRESTLASLALPGRSRFR